jgi:hypothetical protein
MEKTQPKPGPAQESTSVEIAASDILVGIPTYNNARTIGHIVRAASAGLSRSFPDRKAVFLISDGGSFDDTPRIAADSEAGVPVFVQSHRVNPADKISTPYHGIPGRGHAVQSLLEAAQRIDAKACAILDGDLWNLPPDWVGDLLGPILNDGYDYVAPYYRRHRYDGGITGCVVYPVTRALYGKRIRQPIGGQIGLSGGLIRNFLKAPVWNTDTAQFGLDIWMTASAVSQNCRIGEVRLGAKRHDIRRSPADLSTMLVQILGSLFTIMGGSSGFWKTVKGSESVPLFGRPSGAALIPVRVDVDRMRKAFSLGLKEFLPVWEGVLSGEVLAGLRSLDAESASVIDLPDALWVRLIYDFALASNRKIMNPRHLLKSFTPLYLGKMTSYILETQSLDERGAEAIIERLCLAFEAEKPYLAERWDRSAG